MMSFKWKGQEYVITQIDQPQGGRGGTHSITGEIE